MSSSLSICPGMSALTLLSWSLSVSPGLHTCFHPRSPLSGLTGPPALPAPPCTPRAEQALSLPSYQGGPMARGQDGQVLPAAAQHPAEGGG